MCAWNNTQRFIVRNVDHPKPDIFSFARTIAADGIEVPSGSATCLHLATTGSYSVLMKILVEEHNANVNAIDKQGSTPLHWACQKGNVEMIEYLIKHKAKVNTVDFGKFLNIIMIFNEFILILIYFRWMECFTLLRSRWSS